MSVEVRYFLPIDRDDLGKELYIEICRALGLIAAEEGGV
jgi:hypothetical protein